VLYEPKSFSRLTPQGKDSWREQLFAQVNLPTRETASATKCPQSASRRLPRMIRDVVICIFCRAAMGSCRQVRSWESRARQLRSSNGQQSFWESPAKAASISTRAGVAPPGRPTSAGICAVRANFAGLVVVALTGTFVALVARCGVALPTMSPRTRACRTWPGIDHRVRGREELLAGRVALGAALHAGVGDVALVRWRAVRWLPAPAKMAGFSPAPHAWPE
jgi:hypothetical protein